MSPGEQFGDNRFMRLNFGCPRVQLERAVARLEAAVSSSETLIAIQAVGIQESDYETVNHSALLLDFDRNNQ